MPPGKTHHIHAASVFAASDFPLAVMRLARHGDVRLHDHAFHELVLIMGGTGRHLTAHGAYALRAGDVFLIRGATRHGYVNTRDLCLTNILFDPRRLGLPLPGLDLGTVPGFHALFRIGPSMRQAGRPGMRLGLSLAQLEGADGMIADLEEELRRRQPGCRFMACSHLMRLIGFLSRAYSGDGAGHAEPGLGISRVLGHMEQHYAEPLTVKQLARIAGMSESSFMRRFRETIGRSPIDYLIQARIRKACDLLRGETVLKLQDVAMRCGFDDGNYFSRRFRLVTGYAPRAYREASRMG